MNGIEKFRTLKPNNLVHEVVALIENRLPFFSRSEEFTELLVKKKNENQHSTAFCLYLTNHCKSHFNFMREGAQKGSSTIDITVYKGSSLIFVIEAKLLPTPTGTKKVPRDRHEYVYGKGAAIQRFKKGFHGVDNQDRLFSESGIIAFIKENNYDFWHKQINEWIININWDSVEQLEKLKMDEIAILISKHHREDSLPIKLYHFWTYV